MHRTVTALALAVALHACGTTEPEPPTFELPATFVLTSVDGDDVPAILSREGDDAVVLSGITLRLSDDGTFESQRILRLHRGDTTTFSVTENRGAIRRQGDLIHLTPATLEGSESLLEIVDPRVLIEETESTFVLRFEWVADPSNEGTRGVATAAAIVP